MLKRGDRIWIGQIADVPGMLEMIKNSFGVAHGSSDFLPSIL